MSLSLKQTDSQRTKFWLPRGQGSGEGNELHLCTCWICNTVGHPDIQRETRHEARTSQRGQGLTHSGFSVFTGVIVYEVTANTEFVNSAEMQA